ncbi:L,D-transpeptidase family protein [Desulfolutivibrio sulfodismutans]|nr:L,D-transpeptidase family protein [Desulfolutivibrio sulfodismutans]QLA11615.1 L,D-transpeptidase family protein [Desulfolutivibrio sulfodismutans DSM 3696]
MKRVVRLWVAVILLGAMVALVGGRANAEDAPTGLTGPAASAPDGDSLSASSVRHEAVRLQGLCLLAGPDAGAATKKVLRAGEVVRVVATDGAWAEIEARGGVRGFVLGGYLTGFSQEVPAPYRDRLIQVARRPGSGDAVGSLMDARAEPQALGQAGPTPQGDSSRDGQGDAAMAQPAAPSVPAHAATGVPVPAAGVRSDPATPGSSAPSASLPGEPLGCGAMAPDAAAGKGVSASAPAPDPQGGDRLVAYVLNQLRRPAEAKSTDRLDAAGRDYYERKNRYMIEVFLADNILVLYEKQPDGVRRPAKTYRVATPAGDVEAPAGWGVITQIEFEPWWRPTENMKRRAKQKGRSLPDVMPPGVKNPMGPFKMHLSHGFAYRIHGNNDPKSIGKRVTNGCIRMRNDEGLELAKILDVGTEVVISAHASPTVGQGVEAIAPGP